MGAINSDFRQAFGQMAPQAIISRVELAVLLSTTEGAVSQMSFRGELPATAFPGKRRACWFVSDIRSWLDRISASRATVAGKSDNMPAVRKIGRPRLPAIGGRSDGVRLGSTKTEGKKDV